MNRDKMIWISSCDFNSNCFDVDFFSLLNIPITERVINSTPQRQAEYFSGRYVAKLALQAANVNTFNVGIGENRCPMWPSGWHGSISHTDNKAVAVISEDTTKYIGVDIENIIDPLTADSISDIIHTRKELILLTEFGFPTNIATSLLFSAKESLFKATYPYIGYYFGFENARALQIDTKNCFLTLELNATLAKSHGINNTYYCDYKLIDNYVVTMIIQK
ncbi:4'-phosphopantetheinyl transferase superfamily protein [Vibrio sp. ZSDZ65]|uniref:Enterobactin synthase component D n=1 Tax=Vibrio qingdaonensis TaxID=2829491 RepID=A0A9X3HY46_9VIBR|nr:4'-phosphopantetheinyl transferase superfamily protein [Vibrio qingdaonensis]MCW8347918.1 4'-phosphopantetheinyl transferase superfamily protein [Vibrio qingdaonensis]